MDIINLDDHRKIWKTDAAACAACGHKWQAVYPVGAEDVGLECPACGSGLGSVLPPSRDIVERLRSVGGIEGTTRWYINPDGPEAADEIEKLREERSLYREALREISCDCDIHCRSDGVGCDQWIAHAALKEGEAL
jgi:DNA-directed RNA polymerase subunit RPC12/RpoP